MKTEFLPVFRSFLNAARDFLLPDICCICGELTGNFICKEKIFFHINGKQFSSPYCKSCTKELERALINSRARSRELKFDSFFLFDYSHKTTKQTLYHIKHHQCKKCRQFLADILSPLFERFCDKDTVITYIPRNRQNFEKFGFDQSKRILDSYISCHPSQKHADLFERKRLLFRDVQQKFLDYASRAENARETLALKKNIVVPEKVLLFDDMVTTGATITAASELLYGAGAKHITAVTVAATILEDSHSQ